jgi:dihydrofolate reductase
MRRIVAGFAVSLDGYMEGPNGEYDWMYERPAPEFDIAASAKRFDTFLIGRKTYDKLIAYNDSSFNKFNKYVFSNNLKEVEKGYSLVNGDIAGFLTALKEEDGKDIAVYGGASLLSSLLDIKVVDEISMTAIPVLLGRGNIT